MTYTQELEKALENADKINDLLKRLATMLGEEINTSTLDIVTDAARKYLAELT